VCLQSGFCYHLGIHSITRLLQVGFNTCATVLLYKDATSEFTSNPAVLLLCMQILAPHVQQYSCPGMPLLTLQ
jgi:hypothetical protein